MIPSGLSRGFGEDTEPEKPWRWCPHQRFEY